MSTAFFAIGLVIALAAFLGAWAYFFKFPLILAYIITGIVVGPFLFKDAGSGVTFNLLRDLGLSFLLFLVGLEIKTEELKQFGRESIITATVQMGVTLSLGIIFSLVLGFNFLASVFIAVAVTFSSTIIVVKLLHEKRDYDSLYGKLTVSILLLQDLVAIAVLIILASFQLGAGKTSLTNIGLNLVVGIVALGLIYYLNQKFLPYLFERLARNIELLFLSSLAWLFLVTAIFAGLNFSLEIGAFIAGLGLASLKEEHQIASRVRPLRDFFIVIFFIVLGSHIVIDISLSVLFKAAALSLFVLLVKPLIVVVTLGRQGFKRRTSFMSGMSLAQISEFSLIILFLALSSNLINNQVVEVVTLTMLVTIVVSSYNLVFAHKIYRVIEKYLRPFEVTKRNKEFVNSRQKEDHIVLIGAGRLGWEILKQIEKQNKEVLVVDFNPTTINILKDKGIDCLFGDITDPDIYVEAGIDKASLVISTVFDPEDTEEILEQISLLTKKPIVFVTAAERDWAVSFYRRGASYVIIPRILSGHQVAHLLSKEKLLEIREGEVKKDHLEELRSEMSQLGLQ